MNIDKTVCVAGEKHISPKLSEGFKQNDTVVITCPYGGKVYTNNTFIDYLTSLPDQDTDNEPPKAEPNGWRTNIPRATPWYRQASKKKGFKK